MNRNPEQRTRRIAARIAAIAVLALTPLTVTTGAALADPGSATQISDRDSHSSGGRDSDDGHHFGDNRLGDSKPGDYGIGDNGFGWDDNGHYGYRDHNRQNYDGWNDQFNSGHTDRESHDSHTGYRDGGDRDHDGPASHGHSQGGAPQTWNMPNPYIPPPPPALLPAIPALHLPPLPHLPLPMTGLPGLPGTGSAF
ncbi:MULTISPECIES: hypothetical protein [Nocardia]|uniref:hypothetical protein n=1 Tax=Nocardia TaxID=1817 RepID=UPI001895C39C|nr:MULTISPECIES: hypothetical protein [Nocardia]MBF6352511.1 hypothetical protein [Nocardia flavorosea]